MDVSARPFPIHIVSLFPRIFDSWLAQGVVSRAIERGLVSLETVDLRPFGVGRHQVTDDYPFGGGAGMVMKPEPLFAAIESLAAPPGVPRILLTPRGKSFSQARARHYAEGDGLVLVCGHYEGVDQRVIDTVITEELSIGDYVLSAGELAAMVVADAIVRLLPGALSEGSTEEESFSQGLLEYPQYTRPATYRDLTVPEILLSGHHGEVARWRRRQALALTARRRPDLLSGAALTSEDRAWLEKLNEPEEKT